jgi:hypothetical protein
MSADEFYGYIADKYPGREVWIDASADGENGPPVRDQR